MRLIDRFLSLVGLRRHHLFGAVGQPSDLRTAIQMIRARTYYRLTGKKLVGPSLESTSVDRITDKMSPSKRLARRSF